jgi:flagellar biosynthesis protein FliP
MMLLSPAALAASSSININLGSTLSKPSDAVLIILGVTILSVVPSLFILLTGFVRITIVLSLARQALGLTTIPPNQVIAGIALFVSLFIMAPTLSKMNHDALQPYLAGKMNATQAYRTAEVPLEAWLLRQTGSDELAMTEQMAHVTPKKATDAPLQVVIPAFLLSQLKSAFIIGFVIFIPFLIIDLIVSATLMSMGIVMLPPTLVSLPFKLLLFVLVDGWALVLQSLVASFR